MTEDSNKSQVLTLKTEAANPLVRIDGWEGKAIAMTPVVLNDGWESALTGFGTGRDKAASGAFYDAPRLPDTELVAMYMGDDLPAKTVEFRPKEMMRRGYSVEVNKKTPPNKVSEAFTDYATRLELNEAFLQGMIWGRLFGGAVLLIGAIDGQDFSKPLDEERIKTIAYVNVIDRRYLTALQYYSDPLSPKYNKVELYQVTNSSGTGISIVHESRVIRFDGHPVDIQKRRQLAGWTLSVLQRPYDKLRTFGTTFQSISNLIADFSQGVFSIDGLMEMIASGESSKLRARMALDDMMRSTARSVVLDKNLEDFKRVQTPLAGLPEVIDRLMMWLSAALDIPVSILFGRSAAGMNATGEMDFRAFYDTVASEQSSMLGPLLKRMYQLISKAKDFGAKVDPAKIGIKFRPLFEPTDLEQAQIEKTIGDRDGVYIDRGVVTAEEVALSRFGDGGFQIGTTIDVKARLAAQKSAVSFDPYPNDDPEDENVPAPGDAQGEGENPTTAAAGASAPSTTKQASGRPVRP